MTELPQIGHCLRGVFSAVALALDIALAGSEEEDGDAGTDGTDDV